jgi:hypothetical protein
MERIDEIRTAIHREGFDENQLRLIEQAIATRRKMLLGAKKNEMRVGTRVRINETARPQYLQGCFAKIVQVNPKKIVIALEEGPLGRFRGDRIVCPVLLVDIVE